MKSPGAKKAILLAKNTPANPDVLAPIANAITLYFSGLMPGRLGRDLVLADRRPGAADPGVLEEVEQHDDDHDHREDQVVPRQVVAG